MTAPLPAHRRDLEPDELEALVTRLAAEPDRWRHLVRHDPNERTYEGAAAR